MQANEKDTTSETIEVSRSDFNRLIAAATAIDRVANDEGEAVPEGYFKELECALSLFMETGQ